MAPKAANGKECGRRSRRTKTEREAPVAAIELNVAREIVLRSRQPLSLTAIPLDQEGRTLHGIRAKWESSDKRVVFVRKIGEAIAGLPGKAAVRATKPEASPRQFV